MFNFTTSIKKAAILCVVAFGGVLAANAATIYHNGIKYTSSGTNLTVAKADATSGAYTGDIVIESPVTIDGVEYKVVALAGTAFKTTEVTSVYLPDDCIKIPRGAFQDCPYLKTVRLSPLTTAVAADWFKNDTSLVEITIPGNLPKLDSNQFSGCTGLKKITIDAGETEFTLNLNAFGGEIPAAIEEVVIKRPLATVTVATAPFKGVKTLKSVTVDSLCVALGASYFAGCSALENVSLHEGFTTLNTALFSGTAIKSITIPAGVKDIPSTCFSGCASLTEVVLSEGLETISSQAFEGSPVATIALPQTLTSVGQLAFNGSNISGDFVLPAAVKSIGANAFQNNTAITSVSLPASITSIGDGAFNGCSSIASYTVDAANTTFKVKENNALASIDGSKIVAYPVAHANTEFEDTEATAIAAYAFNGAKNLTKITTPACVQFGDYSLANTGVLTASLRGTVGRYVLQGCTSLAEVTLENGKEIPMGVCKDCTALTSFKRVSDVTILKQEAFAGCTSLKEVDLGGLLCIIEADAFKGSAVEKIIVGAATPASMTEGVFTAANSNMTAVVPVECVEAYKAAEGWKYLNIEGSADVVLKGKTITMPDGLYYASTDGVIYGVDNTGNQTSYDVGGVPHTFQLLEFQNRIYGASAGKNFVYQNTPIGDGKLFYISQVDGETFQAVVLDNTGNSNGYKDPFALYIYGDTLYVSDRNVAIRKVSANAIALPQTYPSWVENNWLGWYGAPWAYGCVKSGFQITQETDETTGVTEPLYWVGMRYNGCGIYRWKEEHVGTAAAPGTHPDDPNLPEGAKKYPAILNSCNANFSAFYIDEANDHFYIYLVSETKGTPSGLYRVKFSDLMANPDPSGFAALNPVLIDGAPIKLEGSVGSQETAITQLSVDEKGEYMYWCYISPGSSSTKVVGLDYSTDPAGVGAGPAEVYDAGNPLHKSGIKRIKLGEEAPTVQMVVEGVEGYGIVPVNYTYVENSVESIVDDAAARLQVIGKAVTVLEDAIVNVYNAGGALVYNAEVAGVKTVSLYDMATGLYVVEAIFADGSREVVKVVK